MNIDYVYVYPKNWDGRRDSIICQKIKRGEKYSLNPVIPMEEKMKDNKIIQNLDILIDEEEDEEQKAWLQLKRKIHLLKTRREC